MIRAVISGVVFVAIIYVIWMGIYSFVPEARPFMDTITTFFVSVFDWAMDRWGPVPVGGFIVLLFFVLAFGKGGRR